MSKNNTVRVVAPATVANLSCGFDVMGLAVEKPGDIAEMTLAGNGVVIKAIHGDGGLLPAEAAANTAGVAVLEFLKAQKLSVGIEIILHKNLPLGSGMGSSAASAVAAVTGANYLVGSPLTREELLPFVMEAERIACGAAHADNAAPCLMGGLILVRHTEPLDLISIPTPKELTCVLVHPDIEVKTRDARKVLKDTLSLKNGILQWANTAALVAGMMKADYDLIGRALTDVVAEPTRSILIPNFEKIKEAARLGGALGCGISGSGPAIFCLCRGIAAAQTAGQAIQQEFEAMGIHSETYVSFVNTQGAIIF